MTRTELYKRLGFDPTRRPHWNSGGSGRTVFLMLEALRDKPKRVLVMGSHYKHAQLLRRQMLCYLNELGWETQVEAISPSVNYDHLRGVRFDALMVDHLASEHHPKHVFELRQIFDRYLRQPKGDNNVRV